MPTYRTLPQFMGEFKKLSEAQQRAFLVAVVAFRTDLAAGKGFRAGLRVKKMSGHDVWEMTWAPDGRATFSYGDEVRPGHPHIEWRRIGSHNIFDRP
jgi:hypothetical protein